MSGAQKQSVSAAATQTNRIAQCLAGLREQGRKALIPFVTAGDPNPELTVPLMHAMVKAGANIIELGVPFSDPMADGPVIQRASERALKFHVSLRRVLDMVRSFREHDSVTPVVLMGYLNPIEAMGYEPFARAAQEAGADGVLTVDMPPEEAQELVAALRAHGIAPIFLLAPTSTAERIAKTSALPTITASASLAIRAAESASLMPNPTPSGKSVMARISLSLRPTPSTSSVAAPVTPLSET